MKKLGITLRSCHALGYQEPRDGLARDWYRLLQQLGWGSHWILLPNLGADSVAYALAQNIEGLILTGGDDLGCDVQRDESERALLRCALSHEWPVLGVCRGMQLMHDLLGGISLHSGSENHVAKRHRVSLSHAIPWWDEHAPVTLDVNSYHSNLIPPALTSGILPLAWDDEGYCEAFFQPDRRLAGVMWHPEREAFCHPFDRQLWHWLFA